MTKVALRIFSIKLLKITYQIAKLINGKNPRAKTEERKMANTSVIVIPEGKICDYVDGKFRNDTPEEYKYVNDKGQIDFMDYNDIPSADGNLDDI